LVGLFALGVVVGGCRDEERSGGGGGGGASLDGGLIALDAAMPDGAIALDAGADGGLFESNAVVVTLHALNLGPLVRRATLEVDALEAHSDRGDAFAAVLPLSQAIDLSATERYVIEDAIPATYGELHLVGIRAIHLDVAGVPLSIDLGGSRTVELRCPTGGAYLSFGGAIAMDAAVDFEPIRWALEEADLFPPLLGTTRDDAALVELIAGVLMDAGTIDCAPLP
jgi:hypothetical protein